MLKSSINQVHRSNWQWELRVRLQC